jgi:hypothetical protein
MAAKISDTSMSDVRIRDEREHLHGANGHVAVEEMTQPNSQSTIFSHISAILTQSRVSSANHFHSISQRECRPNQYW